MEEIKPKKERKFLKSMGEVALTLVRELLLNAGKKLINKSGNKRQGLVLAFIILASTFAVAQYPSTGNKQRLGYQTTGDGLVFRGRANDTTTIKSSGLNNAYFILDTVNNVLFNYIKTKGGWVFNNTDTVINNITVDTTSLSNRINLKLNISDTASMLTPYFKDADTTSLNLTSRFAAKLNISDTASMLTNYLRTGVAASTYQAKLNGTGFVKASGTTITYDNSTYLTTATAASIYLPLIGGTVSGTINRQEGSNDGSTSTFYYNILNYFAKRDNNKGGQTAQITFTDRPGTSTFENNVRTSDIYLMTAKNFSGGQLGQYLDTTLSVVANQDGGRVGISKLNPAYKLDVNGTFNATGASLIGGTLGVTGATTLSNLSGASTTIVTASTTGLLSGISTLPIANGGTGATTQSTARTALGATIRGANTFILPDLGAISFLRYNADNTVSQRAADGMRTDLGGTTIGQSMFTLTNPSAITFPRFNADNTVSALDATTFRTAIGAGTGSGNGTVTSVTGTAPISVATGTTTPAITIANAGVSTTGVVTASTQTFGGAKTFNGVINASSDLNVTGFSTLTGGASIGTMASTSSLTHVLGVNSSNAIGEIALGNSLTLSSGTLNVTATGTFTTTNNNYTITSTDKYIAFNNNFSNITVTLPSASGNTGRELHFRNLAAGSIISASNNVINNTVTTGTPDNSILSAGNTNYKWCMLVSDGIYWIKMSGN